MEDKKPSDKEPAVYHNENRRDFLKQSSILTAFAVTPQTLLKAASKKWDERAAGFFEKIPLSIEVNGKKHELSVEPRVALLDFLREQ
jgi:xanthine dehydrogenase YagT iron-sulfur-binding subunit